MILTATKQMWCTGHEDFIQAGEAYSRESDGSVLCMRCAMVHDAKEAAPETELQSMIGRDDIEFPACSHGCPCVDYLGAGECESVCPQKFDKTGEAKKLNTVKEKGEY